ncbi:MAG: hypothetical protein AAFU85_22925, partial [Planctomycetota bacterium]
MKLRLREAPSSLIFTADPLIKIDQAKASLARSATPVSSEERQLNLVALLGQQYFKLGLLPWPELDQLVIKNADGKPEWSAISGRCPRSHNDWKFVFGDPKTEAALIPHDQTVLFMTSPKRLASLGSRNSNERIDCDAGSERQDQRKPNRRDGGEKEQAPNSESRVTHCLYRLRSLLPTREYEYHFVEYEHGQLSWCFVECPGPAVYQVKSERTRRTSDSTTYTLPLRVMGRVVGMRIHWA